MTVTQLAHVATIIPVLSASWRLPRGVRILLVAFAFHYGAARLHPG